MVYPTIQSLCPTNIGKKFISLLGKHFRKTHKLHKLFNRYCVKVSYSSLANLKRVINGHNENIASYQENTVAEWDSMDRVETKIRGRAFQTLGRAFDFLKVSKARPSVLKQALDRVFC